jgi:hypothetical protein
MSDNEEPSPSHIEQEVEQAPPAPVASLAPPPPLSPMPSDAPSSSQYELIDIGPQNTIELRCGSGDSSDAQQDQSSGVKQTD